MQVKFYYMDNVKLYALQDNQQMLLEFSVKMKDLHIGSMCLTPFKSIYIYI
jgi:hypothetical protein